MPAARLCSTMLRGCPILEFLKLTVSEEFDITNILNDCYKLTEDNINIERLV